MVTKDRKIVVVGAGLVGTLLAIRLAQRGYKVHLYEKRGDMRNEIVDSGRSINLALSDRGLQALEIAGLKEKALALAIPMHGRMLHDPQGNTSLARYSGREEDYINSISRPGLNALLLNAASEYPQVEIFFDHKCTGVDYKNKIAHFDRQGQASIAVDSELIIGADGAGSAVRSSLLHHGASLRFSYSQDFLAHSYKELTIPAGRENMFQIEKNALHIWPRGKFMLIALPNLGGSFTVTLFMRTAGTENSYKALDTAEKIRAFFQQNFPDAYELMPEIVDEMRNNPLGALGTIRCSPWYVNESVMLIGDAAHAVVPFYGQGMNCGFEDVYILDRLLDKYEENWEEVLKKFSALRKKDSDAIADLSLDNFYEMRDHVANEDFNKKHDLEIILEKNYEEYYSKYSLVTFREDLPYSTALDLGRFQDNFLLEIVKNEQNYTPEEILHRIKLASIKKFPHYKIYET